MVVSGSGQTYDALCMAAKSNPRARSRLLRAVAAGACFLIAVSCCRAQEDTSGGSARRRGRRGSSVRIEATSFIRWNKAPIDPSHGASTYWLHVSAENGGGRITGGFAIDVHPQLLGKITAIRVHGASAGQPAASRPAPAGTPPAARLMGTCSYNGNAYEVQIDVLGNLWKPAVAPGGRGSSVKGSISLKMVDARTKAINEAVSARQSSVMIWQN